MEIWVKCLANCCNSPEFITLCRILSLASHMRICSLPVTQKSIWHRQMKSHFSQYHTFQHCLDTFSLNKNAKCLSLDNYKHLINVNGIEHKCSNAHKSHIITYIISHRVFSSVSETWDWYDSMLLHSTLHATLLCFGSYKKCCTQLLRVLH